MMNGIEVFERAAANAAGKRSVRALVALARRIVAFVVALVHRREVQGLLELDDRALKDIGLTRGEVLGVLAEPLAKDPSSLLLVRSVERRARVRALAVSVAARQRPPGSQRTGGGAPHTVSKILCR
jgi:uncharacterized protein YjiS (DUF1127 family)